MLEGTLTSIFHISIFFKTHWIFQIVVSRFSKNTARFFPTLLIPNCIWFILISLYVLVAVAFGKSLSSRGEERKLAVTGSKSLSWPLRISLLWISLVKHCDHTTRLPLHPLLSSWQTSRWQLSVILVNGLTVWCHLGASFVSEVHVCVLFH